MAGPTAAFVTTLVMIAAIPLMIIVYAARYVKVSPSQAMAVFTRGTIRHVITGGGYEFLPLSERIIDLDLNNVLCDTAGETRMVRLQASAKVKISESPDSLQTAAEHLLGKSDDEIDWIARRVLEGHICQYLANSRTEEVEADLGSIAQRIMEGNGTDLRYIGMEVTSFTFEKFMIKS